MTGPRCPKASYCVGEHCRSCGACVVWSAHPRTGHPHIYDLPAPGDIVVVSHFATCPDAKKWRRSK